MLGLLQVHPHVVKLYNVLHSDRTLTLVFEFCKQVRSWVWFVRALPVHPQRLIVLDHRISGSILTARRETGSRWPPSSRCCTNS